MIVFRHTFGPLCALITLSCTGGLKDPDWDSAGLSLQGGSDWHDAEETEDDAGGDEAGGDDGGSADGEEASGGSGSDDGSGGGGGSSGGDSSSGSDDSGDGEDSSDTDGSSDAGDSSDADGGDEPASGVGGFVHFYYNANAYAADLGVPVVQVSASARLHAPMEGSWLGWMPSLGMCTVDPVRASLGAVGTDHGSSAMLRMGASVVPMSVDGTTFSYLSSDLPMSSWVNSSFYDIEFADGTTVASVVRTTGGFDALDPPILADGAGSLPFATGVSISGGTTFTWSPAATDDGVLISLDVRNAPAMDRKGEVLCNVPDIGSFTIPASAFAGGPFAFGDPVFVGIWRYRISYAISPVDGSIIEGFAQKGAIGTATLSR